MGRWDLCKSIDTTLYIDTSDYNMYDTYFFDNLLTPSIHYAILSFPCGSTGEPTGLDPQHLKDTILPPAGEGGSALISALTSFVNMVLSGEVLAHARFTHCFWHEFNCVTKERMVRGHCCWN